MPLSDVADDAQAKPRASRFSGTGLVDPIEALEDALLIGNRDADPIVAHSQDRTIASLPRSVSTSTLMSPPGSV